ncbi:hypothetical protein ACO0LC_01270 [Undibacterium sp. JH2W]|uniref:hypothetical protein n=1 Tax=Undibacterium sp. JH2W TaxID=3413037 RepID=UPI003BF0499F
MFSFLFAPGWWFEFHPFACGFVALLMSFTACLDNYSKSNRMLFAVTAVFWWIFTYTEATFTVHALRVDLVFMAPVYQILALWSCWKIYSDPAEIRNTEKQADEYE